MSVIGYRTLSEEETNSINGIKTKGIEIGNIIAELESMDNIDSRWVEIGKTQIQQGLMALTRAVTRPTTF